MTPASTAHSGASSPKDASNCGLTILALLLAFPSSGFVQKYTGLLGVLIYLALVFVAVFIIWRWIPRVSPWLGKHFRVLAALTLISLTAGFILLHPLEAGRGVGKCSDRADGLNLAVTRMADGLNPYYPACKYAGPLSVLPGSIVISAPFVALGNSGYQNIFWLGAFLLGASYFFKDKGRGLCLLALPLALSPAEQYEFVSGGDLIANGIFVALLLLVTLKSWSQVSSPVWLRLLSCLLLGMGLASRANFILLVPLFAATLWRMTTLGRAFTASALVVMVASLITLPFYLHDPAGFTPLLSRQKLAIVDHALPWASKMMIGLTAIAALSGAWALLRRSCSDPIQSCFRWCTLVTLCPMVCAVTLSSMIIGKVDFSFMHDRFGLMYVFFALLGWGGTLGQAPQLEHPRSFAA